jgi:sugar phosphate isomerase/epimerase
MRLGISSYTYVWSVGVPGYPQPREPLTALGLVRRAAELGVHVLQIADNLPLDELSESSLDQLQKAADDLGVALEVGTAGIEPEPLRKYLRLAVRLGSPVLRTILDTEQIQPSPDEAVRAMRGVLPDFASAGVTLAIENHDRFPAVTLLEIIKRCESRSIGICLDTANSLGCGEDLQTVMRSLGPYVVNLHLKPFRAFRLPHRKGFVIDGCPAGQGVVNVPRLLADLRELGRDPNVILELWPPPEATIEESIAKEEAWTRESIQYLRQFVKE